MNSTLWSFSWMCKYRQESTATWTKILISYLISNWLEHKPWNGRVMVLTILKADITKSLVVDWLSNLSLLCAHGFLIISEAFPKWMKRDCAVMSKKLMSDPKNQCQQGDLVEQHRDMVTRKRKGAEGSLQRGEGKLVLGQLAGIEIQ